MEHSRGNSYTIQNHIFVKLSDIFMYKIKNIYESCVCVYDILTLYKPMPVVPENKSSHLYQNNLQSFC